jgi:UDP-N-acetylenolpyruvoylglucosamine reductase
MQNEIDFSEEFRKDTESRRSIASNTAKDIVAHPRSIDDVIKVLTNPKHFPSPVRPVGSNSAANRANRAQGGTILDMTKMNRVLRITEDSITVQAGARLSEVAATLAADGKELLVNDEFPGRTIGGVISSSALTVGYPAEPDHLSNAIVCMTVVSPTGEKVTITAEHKRYMNLFRFSHGLTGVICNITLKTRPIVSYRINTTKLILNELAAVISHVTDTRLGLKIHIMPFRNRAWVELRRPCEDQKPIRNIPWKIKKWARSSAMPKVVGSMNKAFSVAKIRDPLIDGVTEATQKLFIGNFADYSSDAQEMSGKFKTLRTADDEVYCCWAFPAEHFGAMLGSFREFSLDHYREHGFRCDLPAQAFRMNQNQDAMLSPSFAGNVFVLKVSSTMARGWDGYTLDLAEFAQQHHGIPLLNQTRSFRAIQVAKVYGMRLRAFRNTRAKLDPEGRMLNQFFLEHVG